MTPTHRPRATGWLKGAAASLAAALAPVASFGWGHAGHVGIGRLAAQALPDEIPAFLRGPLVAAEIGEIGAEPDVSKSTGIATTGSGAIRTSRTVHDAERDAAHFMDLDDNGFAKGGVVALAHLPATRAAFDSAQRAAGQTQYSGGYLPYAMIDGFEQVRKDFGIWRALGVGLTTAKSDGDRAWFLMQIRLRQQLVIRDIGYWSHFVGDASQPLHLSIHYNGWGPHPNPDGFTSAEIHASFEGAFVRQYVDFGEVARQMRPYTDRGAAAYDQRVPAYLAETLAQVVPVYRAAKDSNADDYRSDQPAERAVVTRQLAAGASELRDEIVDAWRQSANIAVGYPLVRVSDVEAGRVVVSPATFGSD